MKIIRPGRRAAMHYKTLFLQWNFSSPQPFPKDTKKGNAMAARARRTAHSGPHSSSLSMRVCRAATSPAAKGRYIAIGTVGLAALAIGDFRPAAVPARRDPAGPVRRFAIRPKDYGARLNRCVPNWRVDPARHKRSRAGKTGAQLSELDRAFSGHLIAVDRPCSQKRCASVDSWTASTKLNPSGRPTRIPFDPATAQQFRLPGFAGCARGIWRRHARIGGWRWPRSFL